MTSIGFLLFVFGWCCAQAFGHDMYKWDWRDLVTTIPGLIGLILLTFGITVWLWKAMP